MDAHIGQHFWDKYIVTTKCYNIPSNVVRWYVKRAEQYIRTFPDLPLDQHTSKDVEKYLKDIGRIQRLQDW